MSERTLSVAEYAQFVAGQKLIEEHGVDPDDLPSNLQHAREVAAGETISRIQFPSRVRRLSFESRHAMMWQARNDVPTIAEVQNPHAAVQDQFTPNNPKQRGVVFKPGRA